MLAVGSLARSVALRASIAASLRPLTLAVSTTVSRLAAAVSAPSPSADALEALNELAGPVSTTLAAPAAGAAEGATGAVPIFAIKRTFQPHVLRKKRKHGFLSRNATHSGRKLLERRRRTGRASLAP